MNIYMSRQSTMLTGTASIVTPFTQPIDAYRLLLYSFLVSKLAVISLVG